jgi:hypothetical protein
MSTAEKTFPIMYSRGDHPGPIAIPWHIAEAAYSAYSARHGSDQSLERLAERGGFGASEMDDLHPSWRSEVDEIVKLRAELSIAKSEIAERAERLADAITAAAELRKTLYELDKSISMMAGDSDPGLREFVVAARKRIKIGLDYSFKLMGQE